LNEKKSLYPATHEMSIRSKASVCGYATIGKAQHPHPRFINNTIPFMN
jgi:hypothetical protein